MFWISSNEFCLELSFKFPSIHNDLSSKEIYEVLRRSISLKFKLIFDKNHKALNLLQDVKRKKLLLHRISFLIKPRLLYQQMWIFSILNLSFVNKLRKYKGRFLQNFYTRFLLMPKWLLRLHRLNQEWDCLFLDMGFI